jgi:hypothetical protein
MLTEISNLIKTVPNWIFILLVVFCFHYGPSELTRVIYVCTWQGTIISHEGDPKSFYLIELVTMWANILLGIALLYFRLKKVKKGG